MITVACVRTGTKYGVEYVENLRDMVARYLPIEHRFICLSDDPDLDLDGVESRLIDNLVGWWGKMALFHPRIRAGLDDRTIYFDLDTVIVGDLTPLAEYKGPFAICENFTRLFGNTDWPCRYGSCVMAFQPGWGEEVFSTFWDNTAAIMARCPKGDQQAIEELVPGAVILQNVLPDGFFLHKRQLADHSGGPPPEAAVVVFGGKVNPDNCGVPWVRAAWG